MARHEHRPASESSSAHGVECIGGLLSDDRSLYAAVDDGDADIIQMEGMLR